MSDPLETAASDQNGAIDPAANGENVAADDPAPAAVDPESAADTPADDTADDTVDNDADSAADDTAADDPDAVEGSGGGDDGGGAGFLSSFTSLFSRNFNGASRRKSRQFYSTCTDRITTPCIVEDFIAAGMGNVPDCTPVHCGNSLCSNGLETGCRIESTVTPFGIGVHFGDGVDKGSPEDNIGACLKYNQMTCT